MSDEISVFTVRDGTLFIFYVLEGEELAALEVRILASHPFPELKETQARCFSRVDKCDSAADYWSRTVSM